MRKIKTILWAFIFLASFSLGGYSNIARAAAVSLDFRNGDVRAIFAAISELGGIGLVLDESVRGTLTISLFDKDPWEAAEIIALARGLSISRQDDTLIVTTASRSGYGLASFHVFPVKYAEIDTLAEAVDMAFGSDNSDSYYRNDDYYQRRSFDRRDTTNNAPHRTRATEDNYRPNRRSYHSGYRNGYNDDHRVSCDYQTNSLIFFGTTKEAADVRRLVEKLDVPAKLISLEAQVIALSKDASKNLGVEWEWSSAPQYPDYETTYETRRYSIENPDGTYSSVYEDVPKVNITRNWRGNSSGIVQFGKGPEGHPFEFYYSAKINALVTSGKAKILARPNVMTVQGKEAVINIGGEVPVQETAVTNATTTTSVAYREAGIILRYTPRVNGDGTITADVHTEVSSPQYVEEMKAYRFQTRSADTTVRLKDGETMVIGGLIGSEESKTLAKIPFLGDLPVLGAFFRNVRRSKTDSEIMIFLTAHVIDDATGQDMTKAAKESIDKFSEKKKTKS